MTKRKPFSFVIIYVILTTLSLAAQDIADNYGKIAFYSQRDDNYDIYVINDNGSNLQRLTTDPATDCWPEWTPDGTHISFTSDRSGKYEIWIMKADGTEQRKLIDGYWHAWSPDGRQIALVIKQNSTYSIYSAVRSPGRMPGMKPPCFLRLSAVSTGLKTIAV